MRRIVGIILLIAVAISLIGCAKLIDTKEEVVEATIVDTYYKDAWIQYIYSGKTMVPITYPAKYEVTLKYKEIQTTIDNSELYSICHGKNGTTIQCILITDSYDDGSVTQYLGWRK